MFFDYYYQWEIKRCDCCSTPPYASGIGMKQAVLNGINFEHNKKGFLIGYSYWGKFPVPIFFIIQNYGKGDRALNEKTNINK